MPLFHAGNSLFPELDKASLKQPSIEVRLQIVGAGTCIQTATTGMGLHSDIIQLSGLSLGPDVDGRTAPLLLHSSPFKPEGVTVSMSDAGGQKKVLDCLNIISDELGLLSCILSCQSEGTVCVYSLFSSQKPLWLTRHAGSKQSLCLHIHCPYFRFQGDVK